VARPVCIAERREVVYTEAHWKMLRELRKSALEIMRALSHQSIDSVTHGSVARGDIDEKSDIDVVILDTIPSYAVEMALQGAGLQPLKREIVIATPWQLPKAHIHLGENRTVTFPLVKPKLLEIEFYHFGGAVNLKQIEEETRVPGVNKQLLLIEPTGSGHVESQVIKHEAEAARKLGVSLDIVRERAGVLARRAKIGRTGIFLKRPLRSDENFEQVFKQIIDSNPAIKIRLRAR